MLSNQDKEFVIAKIELAAERAADKAVEKSLRIFAESMQHHVEDCTARAS